jgi:hypothetical protein
MAQVKQALSVATSLTVTGLSSLASGAYATSNLIDNTGNLYLDYLVEVAVTVGTVAGNQQCVIFAIDTLDQTNFSDATQDANMRLLGTIQTPTNATLFRAAAMSVAAAFGGTLPPQFKIVVKNDSGAAFTTGAAQYIGSYSTVI